LDLSRSDVAPLGGVDSIVATPDGEQKTKEAKKNAFHFLIQNSTHYTHLQEFYQIKI
jgi:hypothetical protein